MSQRLIVTGASGFVAGSVICQAGPEWEVHAFSRKPAPIERDGLRWHSGLDVREVSDTRRLRALFEEIQPDAVIHTAGIADIDYCEQHPDIADDANVDYTIALAGMCRERKVRMVFTSTDTAFDGDKGDYVETDPTEPVNHYGRTKVRAEHAVTQRLESYCIARLAIVMGLPFLGGGNSFLSRLIAVLNERREVPVPAEEIRTPVDVITVGRALLELAGSAYVGTIHLSGNDRMQRVQFSRLIAERLGYPPERIVATIPEAIPGRARRPRDVSLNNSKARAVLTTPMRGIPDGLELILNTRRPRMS